jgi:hypothetical protein
VILFMGLRKQIRRSQIEESPGKERQEQYEIILRDPDHEGAQYAQHGSNGIHQKHLNRRAQGVSRIEHDGDCVKAIRKIMGDDCECHDDTHMEFELESYSDGQSVHEAVSRKLGSPEKPSPMVMYIAACPVGKAYPVNRKIAFEYEEEYETYSGDIHDLLKGYPGSRSQPEGLRKQIKKGDRYKNPGRKSRKHPETLPVPDGKQSASQRRKKCERAENYWKPIHASIHFCGWSSLSFASRHNVECYYSIEAGLLTILLIR